MQTVEIGESDTGSMGIGYAILTTFQLVLNYFRIKSLKRNLKRLKICPL